MVGLNEGRIVHYVLKNGETRAAMVVRAWPPYGDVDGMVNLYVFLDGANDQPGIAYDGVEYSLGILWATSVHYSEEPKPSTWHWIFPGQATNRYNPAEQNGGAAG